MEDIVRERMWIIEGREGVEWRILNWITIRFEKVIYYHIFVMRSGEDSLPSSECSSLMWECMTDHSSDRN